MTDLRQDLIVRGFCAKLDAYQNRTIQAFLRGRIDARTMGYRFLRDTLDVHDEMRKALGKSQ